ncbi:MAG TPA: tol-pal system protein YbgF [Candidatus Xenobia bacterium]|nr:tol-pal system protein YbgF [Candidatus Xenobia bacterium]
MRKVRSGVVIPLLGMGMLVLSLPAAAQKREVIELTKEVELLRQEVKELRQTVERDNAVTKSLVEQALDAVNRMKTTVTEAEQSMRQSQTETNSRVDSLATQVQSLRDAMDELSARLSMISQQLAQTQGVLETVDSRLAGSAGPPTVASGSTASPVAGGGAPPATSTSPPAPAPQSLYDNALRDLNTGKYDLARQQFQEYLQYYGRTTLAGNAQFHIGETYYRQNDFKRAITEYDKVLQNYPDSNKVAASLLKKGYAQLELNQREEGVRTLRSLVEKYPRSDEAEWARRRLKSLGDTAPR